MCVCVCVSLKVESYCVQLKVKKKYGANKSIHTNERGVKEAIAARLMNKLYGFYYKWFLYGIINEYIYIMSRVLNKRWRNIYKYAQLNGLPFILFPFREIYIN